MSIISNEKYITISSHDSSITNNKVIFNCFSKVPITVSYIASPGTKTAIKLSVLSGIQTIQCYAPNTKSNTYLLYMLKIFFQKFYVK